MKPTAPPRADYTVFRPIQTRWADNDIYGHVNNVQYYAYFDTAVNGYLVEAGALDIENGEVIGLVVATNCDYFASVAFPDRLDAGIRVSRIGTSSVTYEIGIFVEGAETAAAAGRFTHVYVDRTSRRPVALPVSYREALAALEG
ncbi:acyl-CoA thioesterase [Rhodobacteraceae bacterium NNCM2]|nr:acyl-CoA thioesterase [Coraliihabitans acroporae]